MMVIIISSSAIFTRSLSVHLRLQAIWIVCIKRVCLIMIIKISHSNDKGKNGSNNNDSSNNSSNNRPNYDHHCHHLHHHNRQRQQHCYHQSSSSALMMMIVTSSLWVVMWMRIMWLTVVHQGTYMAPSLLLIALFDDSLHSKSSFGVYFFSSSCFPSS